MPNAKDKHGDTSNNILIFGHTGAGKTTQFLTLPGRKFAYLFDPNALDSLAGFDVEYEEFLPDKLNLAVKSLSTEANKKAQPSKLKTVQSYQNWEKHFETNLESGYFDQFDAILFDSITTFSDMVMDEVLRLNSREGQWPQQDDYGPQMNAIMKVFRVLTSMGKTIYATGHMELVKDETSGRIVYQPLVTGRLKTKLPLLFSQIFALHAEAGQDKKVNYKLQTKPDRQTPLIRCTWRNLSNMEPVDIDFNKPIEGQGLGGILAKHLASKPV